MVLEIFKERGQVKEGFAIPADLGRAVM